ncbi:hypothetical protein [Alkalihalobacillus sp. BA299]|uniref:hypothetical protein n=1 Tax=Alkalihalobacillus sp. BA299 TaxID=2815938 RepID=UPI001ADA0C43|nr:hypothetical protein [Alkalihalobacillus sp. BA299]
MSKQNQSENTVVFNLEKMKKFADQDALIKFMANDLAKKNGNLEEAYQIVFNSEVLGDSTMEDIYKSL